MSLRTIIAAASLSLIAGTAMGQGANIAFGNIRQDSNAPVEVSADSMSINQNTGAAVLTGNVLIGQGAMRLSARKVDIVYSSDRKQINRLSASGGVTLVSGTDAAEARSADYNVENGMIVLTGDVLLVQGNSAITADKMRVDTKSGTAEMQGRVKTVLNVEN